MLSRAPERRMRAVRFVLLLAWLILILSLFYDPLTPALTSPDNLASPFRTGASPTVVQGAPLPAEPYPMSCAHLLVDLCPDHSDRIDAVRA